MRPPVPARLSGTARRWPAAAVARWQTCPQGAAPQLSPRVLPLTAATGTREAVLAVTCWWPRAGRWPKIQHQAGARGPSTHRTPRDPPGQRPQPPPARGHRATLAASPATRFPEQLCPEPPPPPWGASGPPQDPPAPVGGRGAVTAAFWGQTRPHWWQREHPGGTPRVGAAGREDLGPRCHRPGKGVWCQWHLPPPSLPSLIFSYPRRRPGSCRPGTDPRRLLLTGG